MKKTLLLAVICLALLAGCGKDADSSALPSQTGDSAASTVSIAAAQEDITGTEEKVDIEIKEKMFIAQTNEIYLNSEDYLGKTIKYEGVFDIFDLSELQIEDYWEGEALTFYSVIRYGPGCCGNDGNVGFEVIWDGEYPQKNDWVEVVGTLETYEDGGVEYLRIRLSSLNVLPTRGEEYVTQ